MACLEGRKVNIPLVQAIFYFLSVALSFCVVIPVGIVLRNFHGSCILYAQIGWNSVIWTWSETSCDYVLYMNLGATLIYAFMMGCFCLFLAIPKRWPFARQYHMQLAKAELHDRNFVLTGLNAVFIFINGLVAVMVLASAIVLMVGLSEFCKFTMDKYKSMNEPLDSCQDAQDKIDWSKHNIIRGTDLGVDGHNFFTCLMIASIANWLLLIVWVAQWLLNFFQGCTMCSCEVAEEKRKYDDQYTRIAQRRSRLTTPIHTPRGRPGNMTPPVMYPPPAGMRPMGAPPPQQQRGPQSYTEKPLLSQGRLQ